MRCRKKLGGRPVKFFEDRSENYLTTTHGRDHITDVEVGATKDGKITALKVNTFANIGAYFSTIAAGIPTTLYGRMIAGCYKIPNIRVDVIGTYTNTAMVDAYRGAGRPEAAFVIERVCDLVADATGIDPAEVRRRNFIQPDDFPYDTGIGMLPYDSGNYEPALDKALQIVGYEDLKAEQAKRRSEGATKAARHRPVVLCRGLRRRPLEVDRSSRRRLGCRSVGERERQGPSDRQGRGHDRHRCRTARGTRRPSRRSSPTSLACRTTTSRSSTPTRSARRSASAATAAARWRSVAPRSTRASARSAKRRQARRAHAGGGGRGHRLGGRQGLRQGRPDAVEDDPGDRARPSVAYDLPEGMEPFLDETTYYDPPNCTFPFGTHICVVEVDRETGRSKYSATSRSTMSATSSTR